MHEDNVQLHGQSREQQEVIDRQQRELEALRQQEQQPREMTAAPQPAQPTTQPASYTIKATATPPTPPQIAGTETTADPVAGTVTVRVPGDVLFDPGQAMIRSTARTTLDNVAAALRKDYPGKQIRVEGHTDADPIRVSKWKSNQELSEARAKAVKDYLASKGVSATTLTTQGFGADRPKSKTDKAMNRRVEIVVVTR
jgi:outer membrane protein OmpA-like peptidoglycan-associated protein